MTSEPEARVSPPPLRVRVLESLFRLDLQFQETHDALARDWSRCVVDGPPLEGDLPFEVHGEELPLRESFGYRLASQLTLRAIGELGGQRLMLHAAGLADPAGRVVVLVGPSGTGKTTAARTLGSAGWGYVTDETVAIDHDGRVTPYPKPLSLVDDPARPYSKTNHGPDTLGLGLAPPELTVGRLVVLERDREGNVEPRLADLPLLEAVIALIPHTSYFARMEAPLQRLCRLAAEVGVRSLAYSEVADTRRLLDSVLGLPVPAADWEPLPLAAEAPLTVGAFAVAVVHDAVRIGWEGLVLVGNTPVRLSPLGLTIWRRAGAAAGATLEDLVESAIAEHGDHPDAATVLEEAVEAMVTAGLLVRN